MDETDPVARAQPQLQDDLELVQRYGREEAADHFGGCYWVNGPLVTIVALFTAKVDRHRTVLLQPRAVMAGAHPSRWQ